jgi:hypothetical protein
MRFNKRTVTPGLANRRQTQSLMTRTDFSCGVKVCGDCAQMCAKRKSCLKSVLCVRKTQGSDVVRLYRDDIEFVVFDEHAQKICVCTTT